MKVKDSTRLWYGQYTRKVVFSANSASKIKNWLSTRNCDFAIRRYRSNKTVVVFLTDESVFNDISLAFASDLREQHKPANDAIANYIQNNTHVEIRKQLLYKLYRHKIYFRFHWLSRGSPALVNFVTQHLANREDYTARDFEANYGSYTPCLYLAHDSDLMMVKMSVDAADIIKITTIKLAHEV